MEDDVITKLSELGLEETVTTQLTGLGFTQELVTSLLNDSAVQDVLKLAATEKPMTVAELKQQQMEQYARRMVVEEEDEVEQEDVALLPKKEFDLKKYIHEEAVKAEAKVAEVKKRSAQDAGLVEVKVLQEGLPGGLPTGPPGGQEGYLGELETLPVNYEGLFEKPNPRVQKKIDKRIAFEKLTRSWELKMAFFEDDIDTVRVLLSLHDVEAFDWFGVIRDAGLSENVKLLHVLYDLCVLEPGPNREWREAFAGIPSVLAFFDTIKEEEEL